MALNVYVALCYYKLDYYDVSQEVLGLYLNQHPDSVIATNLKVCILIKSLNERFVTHKTQSLFTSQGYSESNVQKTLFCEYFAFYRSENILVIIKVVFVAIK